MNHDAKRDPARDANDAFKDTANMASTVASDHGARTGASIPSGSDASSPARSGQGTDTGHRTSVGTSVDTSVDTSSGRAEAPTPATPFFEVSGLQVGYGQIEAVKGIDFSLDKGKITTLVGANGAGKSTTLLALSGLIRKTAGSVMLEGENIASMSPHKIVSRGVVQVAEGRATLATLTVRENLELGAYTVKDRSHKEADLERMFTLFPRLKERQDGMAGNLSGGEQQMLAIGRALMARPRLLLLDEPSMGLAPIIVQEIFRILRANNRDGLTIFLVEQNVRQALKIADKAYVIETGSIVLTGSGRSLLDNPRVQAAYLGG